MDRPLVKQRCLQLEPLYMLGWPLKATYPVVPLADRHAVSIGMTTIRDQACFGVYADRESLPDAGILARDIDQAITELLASASPAHQAPPPGAKRESDWNQTVWPEIR
jgi:WS/DGAT C-terminal domain